MGSQAFASLVGVGITIGLFIMGLLLGNKFRVGRVIVWSIGGVVIVGMVVEHYTKSPLEQKIEKDLVGTYQLDTLHSSYHQASLRAYPELVLEVKEDHTFEFTEPNPFFGLTQGKWEVDDFEEYYWVIGHFQTQEYKYLQTSQRWEFTYRVLQNGKPGDKLIFKRK